MSGFRLITVERLRGKQLEICARALHAATGAVQNALGRREELLDRLNGAEGLARGGTITGSDLALAGRYRDRLRERIAAEGVQIRELQEQLETARAGWVTARGQLRAVQSLHAKHRAAQLAAQVRRDQRELDEHAGQAGRGRTRSTLMSAQGDQ